MDELMNEWMKEGIFTLFCTTHSRLLILPCLFAPVYEGCFFHRKKNKTTHLKMLMRWAEINIWIASNHAKLVLLGITWSWCLFQHENECNPCISPNPLCFRMTDSELNRRRDHILRRNKQTKTQVLALTLNEAQWILNASFSRSAQRIHQYTTKIR